ncbi:MAG: hypothetical protein Q7J77_03070, partial [Undibacterium sp.]|nr:hypothetical protein [Undibacterium sp.]
MNKTKILLILAVTAGIAGGAYALLNKKETGKVDGSSGAAQGAGNNPQNKPVTVATVLAQKRDYAVKLAANGVVTALNIVEIRPQVTS